MKSEMMYEFENRMMYLYSLFTDSVSKEIFWKRLRYVAEPSMDNAIDLMDASGRLPASDTGYLAEWRRTLAKIRRDGKELVLYGAGEGGRLCSRLLEGSGVEFSSYCDKNRAGETVDGKRVIPVDELIQNKDKYFIFISIITKRTADEAIADLERRGFPRERMVTNLQLNVREDCLPQYCEFISEFSPGTAFIDGGSFDGRDSAAFAGICDSYSKIMAFEPSPAACENIRRTFVSGGSIDNLEVIEAGLGAKTETVSFVDNGRGGSFIDPPEKGGREDSCLRPLGERTTIRVVALDDLTADIRVGMVKMDIEGAEFPALCGMEKTLLRDRPILAVCVYHLCGDMLAIMDYLHRLIPKYRFYLRQYSSFGDDTVLYAIS